MLATLNLARYGAALALLAALVGAGWWAAGKYQYGPRIESLRADLAAAEAAARIAKTVAEANAERAQHRINEIARRLKAAERRPTVSPTRVCLAADELRILNAAARGDRATTDNGAGGDAGAARDRRDAAWW